MRKSLLPSLLLPRTSSSYLCLHGKDEMVGLSGFSALATNSGTKLKLQKFQCLKCSISWGYATCNFLSWGEKKKALRVTSLLDNPNKGLKGRQVKLLSTIVTFRVSDTIPLEGSFQNFSRKQKFPWHWTNPFQLREDMTECRAVIFTYWYWQFNVFASWDKEISYILKRGLDWKVVSLRHQSPMISYFCWCTCADSVDILIHADISLIPLSDKPLFQMKQWINSRLDILWHPKLCEAIKCGWISRSHLCRSSRGLAANKNRRLWKPLSMWSQQGYQNNCKADVHPHSVDDLTDQGEKA